MALDFPGSPATGTTYTGPGGVIWVWDSQKWVSGTLTTGIYAPITNDVGRNLIHNSMFNIAQRGAGPWATTGLYTVDRWWMSFVTGTFTVSRIPLGDTDRSAIGDEAAIFAMQGVVASSAGATALAYVSHPIEGVRRLSGKTVTVSFYAKAASSTPKVGISIDQSFGSGGSSVPQAAGQAVIISTTWARYSLTIAIPSASGKTTGSNGDDCLNVNVWLSAGANNATNSGSVGVQNGTFQLWGVQLEIGSVATPLEKRDPVYELQQCQRFYYTGSWIETGWPGGVTTVVAKAFLPVTMRGTITVVPTTTTNSNCSVGTVLGASASTIMFQTTVTAAGQLWFAGTFTASADL